MANGTIDFSQYMTPSPSELGMDTSGQLVNAINNGALNNSSLNQEYGEVANQIAQEAGSLEEQLNSAYQASVYGGTEDTAPTGMTPELSEYLRKYYGNTSTPEELFTALVNNRDFEPIRALYGSSVASELADSVGYATDRERQFTSSIRDLSKGSYAKEVYDNAVTVGSVIASIPEIIPTTSDFLGSSASYIEEKIADFVEWLPQATGMSEESIKSFAKTADELREDARSSQLALSKKTGSNSELGKFTHNLAEGARNFHSDKHKAALKIEQLSFEDTQKRIKAGVDKAIAEGETPIYAKAEGIVKEFSAKLESLIDNPDAGWDAAIGVLGDIVVGGALANGVRKLSVKNAPDLLAKKLGYMPSEKEVALWLQTDAAKKYFAKVSERVAFIYTMTREGSSNGSEAYQKTMAMTHEDLMKNSPKYKAYVEEYGMTKEEAKQLLATDAAGQVYLTQGLAAGAASKVTNMSHYTGNFFNKEVSNKVGTATIGSALENTSQGLTGQLAQNMAIKNTANEKQSLTENLGKGAAEGFVGGIGGGVISNAPKVAAATIGTTAKVAAAPFVKLGQHKAAKKQEEFSTYMDNAATNIDDIIDGKAEVNTSTVENTVTPDSVSDTAAEKTKAVTKRASNIQEAVPDIPTEQATELAKEFEDIDTSKVPKESREPIIKRENFVPIEQAFSPDNTLLAEIKGDAKTDNVIAEKGVGHLFRKTLDILSRGDESVPAQDIVELSSYIYQVVTHIEDSINNNYTELAQLGTSKEDVARKAVLVDAIRRGEAALQHDSEIVSAVAAAASTILQNVPNMGELMQEYADKAESLASAPIEQVRPVLFQLANSPELFGDNTTTIIDNIAQNPNLSPVDRVILEAIQITAPSLDSSDVRDNIFNTSRDGFKSIRDHYAGIARAVSVGNASVLKANMEGLKRFADHMSTKAAVLRSALVTARTTGETVHPINPKTNKPYLQKDGTTPVYIKGGSHKHVEAVEADAAKVREATDIVRGIANSAVKEGIFNKQQIPSQTVAKPVKAPDSELVQEIQSETPVTDVTTEDITANDIAAKVTSEPSKASTPSETSKPTEPSKSDVEPSSVAPIETSEPVTPTETSKVSEPANETVKPDTEQNKSTDELSEPVKAEAEQVTPSDETVKADETTEPSKPAKPKSTASLLLNGVVRATTYLSKAMSKANEVTQKSAQQNALYKYYRPRNSADSTAFHKDQKVLFKLANPNTTKSEMEEILGTSMTNEAFAKLQGVFGNHVRAFMRNFNGVFKRDLKKYSLDMLPWNRHNSLYFVVDNGNGELGISPQLTMGAAIELTRFVGEELKGMTGNLSKIQDILNDDRYSPAVRMQILKDSNEQYGIYSAVAQRVGRNILRTIGLTSSDNAPPNVSAKIETDIGIDALSLLEYMGYIDTTTIAINTKDEDGNVVSTFQQKIILAKEGLLRSDDVRQGIDDIVSTVGLLSGALYPSDSSRTIRVGKPFRKDEKDGRLPTYRRSNVVIPEVLREFIQNMRNKAWYVVKPLYDLRNNMSERAWQEVGGYNFYTPTKFAADRVNGLNKSIELSMSKFNDGIEQMKVTGEGWIDKSIYINMEIVNNARAMLRSDTINPQGEKEHRQLVSRKAAKVDYNDSQDVLIFQLTLAQALGVSVDKADVLTSLTELSKVLHKPVVNEAIGILMLQNRYPEALTKEQESVIIQAVREGGEKYKSLDALNEYARYLNAKEDGVEFHTQLAYELDGLTHGPFTAYLQLGLDSINADIIKRLQRGGIFVDNNNITYPQFKSNDPTFRDTYEAVADGVNDLIAKKLSGNFMKDAPIVVLLDTLGKYYPKSKAKFTYETITTDNGEELTNLTYTSDRALAKQATTSLGAYSGSSLAVVRQLTGDLISGFRDKYNDAYIDFITTLEKHKDGEGTAHPDVQAKWDAFIAIVQDISKLTGTKAPTSMTTESIQFFEKVYNPVEFLSKSIEKALEEHYVPELVESVTQTTGTLRANTKKLISMSAIVNAVFSTIYHATYEHTLNKLREAGKLSSLELLPKKVEREVFNRVAKVYAPIYALNGSGKKTNEEVSGIAAFKSQEISVSEFMPNKQGDVGVASQGYGFLKLNGKEVASADLTISTVGQTGVLPATNLVQSSEAVLQARLDNDKPNLQHQDNYDGVDVNLAHVQSASDSVNRLFAEIQDTTTIMELVNTQLHTVLDNYGFANTLRLINKLSKDENLPPRLKVLAKDIAHLKKSIYTHLYGEKEAYKLAKENNPLKPYELKEYIADADVTTNNIKAIKTALFSMENTTVDQFPSNFSRFVNNRSDNASDGKALQRWADSARSLYTAPKQIVNVNAPLVQSLATPQIISQEVADAYVPVSHEVEEVTKDDAPYTETHKTYNRTNTLARLERVFIKNKDGVGQHILKAISHLLPDSLEVHVGTTEQMNQLAHELYPAQMNNVSVEAKGMTIGDTVFISNNTSETYLHELIHAALWNVFNNYYTNPASVPVAARKSIAQLEKIAERFLTDTRIADNPSVNILRQVMEKAKAEGDMFTFTQEFVAWTLSNKDIQATAGETSLKGRISKLTRAAFNAIRQLFGMKNIPKVNSYLTNILAHTNNIAQSVRSDITSLSPNNEAVLLQQQYENFSKVPYSDIFAMSSDNTTPEHSAKMERLWGSIYETVTPLLVQRAKEKGINSFDDTIFMNELNTPELLNTTKLMAANGFALSDKQQLLFSALHTVISDSLNSNKELVTVNLDRVYQAAKAQLTPEQLISKGEPVSLGEARYNALFTDAATTSDTVTGKSDRLVNFLSLYATSPQFAEAMQGIQVKADKSQGDFVSRTFETITDKALSLLGNKTLSTHSQVRLDNLLEKLSVIDAEARNTLMNRAMETENKISRAVTRMENRISEAGTPIAEKGMQRAIKASKDYSSEQSTLGKLKAGVVIGEGLAESMLVGNNENNLRDSANAITTMINEYPSKPSKRLGFLSELVNEFMGITHKNRSVAKLLDIAKFVRDFSRQNILETTPKDIKSLFSKPLTSQQSTDITYGWLDTDTSSLIEKGYSIKEVGKLYSDDTKLTSEIASKEAEIISFGLDIEIVNALTKQAKGLGWLMVSNTSGLVNQAPSAQAIVDLVQRSENDSIERAINPLKIDPAIVPVLDDLATLWAIKYLDNDTRSSVLELINTDTSAMESVANFINQLRQEEANKALKGAAKLALKGSTAAIDNPNKALVIAPYSKKSEMANNGYVMGNAIKKVSYDNNTEPMYYYYADNVAKPSWISGIMSTVRQTLGGVNVAAGKTVNGLRIEAYTDTGTVNDIAQNSYGEFSKQFDGSVDIDTTVNHPIPVFDLRGGIVGYEYTVGKAERKARLDTDTDFANVLGTWKGRVFEEMVGKAINRELVNLAYAEYLEDVNKFHIRSHVVIDPKSKDPYIQEIYRMIPPEMKEHIKEVFPDGKLRVRRNQLNNMLGMREWSLNETLNKSPAERNGFEAALAYVTKALFGEKAAYRAGQGTRWLKAYAKLAKNTVIVKNVMVQAVNMISNILQSRARGTSFTDIVKDYTAAMKYADDYRKLAKEQVTLENQLVFNQGNTAKVAKINNRLAEVKDLMARNPAIDLIQAGLLPTISTEETPNDKYEIGYNFVQKLNGYLDNMPKGLSTVAKEAMLLKDSRIYKMLDKTNQYMDFMSKYSLYKQLTERQEIPESHERALNIIQDEFVNYNFIPSRGRQFLDSTGFTWFLNYRIRSQKIIARLTRKHPLRMGGQVAYTALGASTILDTNLITGNWASAFGLTNGFRMIASHPLIALMSGTAEGAANIIRGR